jgi:site-specific DNA recombinase
VKRAALYARVSTDEQAEKGYGLASQLRALREAAAGRGYVVPDGAEFVDDGYSGAYLERPQLDRLREAVRHRAFDVVLTYSLDRLARDLAYSLLLNKEFRAAGVAIEYATMTTDDTPAGIFQEQVLGAVAELERATIKDRTSRGRREKAKRGLVPSGPCPFGYRYDPASPGGLVIVPEEASLVRRMFSWLAEGTSIRRIVDRTNASGIAPRRGGRWAKSSVARILANETYAGRAWYNRRFGGSASTTFRAETEWIGIKVPPIISATTFQRAQQTLNRNRAVMTGHPGHRIYLLKGLLVCGACGRKMHGEPSHGVRVYRCSGRERLVPEAERCGVPSLRSEIVETNVWQTVAAVLRDPDVLMVNFKAARLGLDARRVDAQAEAADLRRALASVRAKRERLLNLYLAGTLSADDPVYARQERELKGQEADVASRLAVLDAVAASADVEAAQQASVARTCAILTRGIDRIEGEGKARLLRLLLDRVVLHRGQDGGWYADIHGLLPTSVTLPDPPATGTNGDAGNRPQSQHVVSAGGRDLERALSVRLPADLGEVAGTSEVDGEERGRIDDRRAERRLGAEHGDGVGERGDAEDGRSGRKRGFGGVRRRHDHAGELGGARGGRDRQRAADRVHAPVEPELAHHAPAPEIRQARRSLGGEKRQRDRQVEGDAFLPDARRCEVHRDPTLRVVEARVPERGADAIPRLAHGAVGEPDGRGLRQARRHVDLDVDEERIDAAKRPRPHAREHRSRVPHATPRRNCYDRNISTPGLRAARIVGHLDCLESGHGEPNLFPPGAGEARVIGPA